MFGIYISFVITRFHCKMYFKYRYLYDLQTYLFVTVFMSLICNLYLPIVRILYQPVIVSNGQRSLWQVWQARSVVCL